MSFLSDLPEEVAQAVETIVHAVEADAPAVESVVKDAAPVVDAIDNVLSNSSQTVTVEDATNVAFPTPAAAPIQVEPAVVQPPVDVNGVSNSDVLAEIQVLRADITSAVSIVADLHAKIGPVLDAAASEGLPGLLKNLPAIMSALKSL